MKLVTVLTLVFFLGVVLLIDGAENIYCQLELEFCKNIPHISCDRHNILPSTGRKKFELIAMTSQMKSFILEFLNEYRNDVALGRMKGFPKAANMALLLWLHEFEMLMEDSVAKAQHGSIFCTATALFKFPYEISYQATGNFTVWEFLTRALNRFTKTEMKSPTDKSWSTFYMAENHRVGCAYGKFVEHTVEKHVLKCLTNKYAQRTLSEAYTVGEPCTACRPDDYCNSYYGGLCIANKMGPIGLAGAPGPPGPPGPPGVPGKICRSNRRKN